MSVQPIPFIPRLLLSLPSPHHSALLVTRRDRPDRGARDRHPRPAAPSWAPALPLPSPAPASHRQMRAGPTRAPPAAHPGRGPSAGGERKALIDPRARPPGDERESPVNKRDTSHPPPPAFPAPRSPRAPGEGAGEAAAGGAGRRGALGKRGALGAALPPPPLVPEPPRRDPPTGPGSFPEETRMLPLFATKAKRRIN